MPRSIPSQRTWKFKFNQSHPRKISNCPKRCKICPPQLTLWPLREWWAAALLPSVVTGLLNPPTYWVPHTEAVGNRPWSDLARTQTHNLTVPPALDHRAALAHTHYCFNSNISTHPSISCHLSGVRWKSPQSQQRPPSRTKLASRKETWSTVNVTVLWACRRRLANKDVI